MKRLAMDAPATPICVLSVSLQLALWTSDGPVPPRPRRSTPCAPHSNSTFRHILASDLTKRIRAAILLHPDPAYTVADVSVRSTRAGGATALLCAGVDSNRIRLIGRWQSGEMYRYARACTSTTRDERPQ